ncbi:MAG: hypothetical protein HW386_2382, partial [Gammaproteobacteria bacterium]|nr:hypothetical protein [Gammaproteobacteria bacterium]
MQYLRLNTESNRGLVHMGISSNHADTMAAIH